MPQSAVLVTSWLKLLFAMAAGVYEDIYKFLQRGQYPPELNKNEQGKQ